MKNKTLTTYPLPGKALRSLDPPEFARCFLPRYCRHPFNPMHYYVFAEYQRQCAEPLPGREGRRLAVAAPRGCAKSTILTFVLPLMDILLQRERHIVIVSATEAQAVGKLTNIMFELMNNERMRDTFFGGEWPDMNKNRKKLEVNGIRVEAYSAGGEMRGLLHGEYRPTRIILDDVESSSGSLRSHGRKKLQTWYDEVIENLGDSYTHITIAGTILHYNSLLSTLLERPGFMAKIYRSVMNWSERGDLWQQWQRLYTDRTDDMAIETAREFYLANRAEMDRGVEVLWPEKEDYYQLQKQLVSAGRAAFFKEKQNSPFRNERQVFNTTTWTRFDTPARRIQILPRAIMTDDAMPTDAPADIALREEEAPRVEPPALADLQVYGYLDPALGKNVERGDYAAIVTIGRDRHNILYVLDVWMERVSPMSQVAQVFSLHNQFNYKLFAFESNGFQETLLRNFREEEAKRAKGFGAHWKLPLKTVQNSANKYARIAQLEPLILTGGLLFNVTLSEEFYTQADEFGTGKSHDDGLDALAGCVELIQGLNQPAANIKRLERNRNLRAF